ncbi:hypothetical protein H112_08894 [Trichophyton rubrum D6]|uniref:Uncharacterized protein n=1 Tax=Trichophyton rubrum CBS 288.86 TaxID=1215330 RepID=A0A022VMQ2_TRIRU|nr:hypothetical protein H100_08915 [Trichophyton rubrum MR850]EZF36607.1 hypothetical protein H102_08875 [Trichophyton rubrum CBS 100081]EZF47251.1 hypothetical protein H103_08895 [Trichophyton rubrum CBS 288.86]EZF57910.1 hypothetical protein H104_08846 [Trichophyton rubrum CBS 289.86]EZF79078.1 hypothetical protein H110_08898 [Trichophyton rubrum MR1448]EZF89883.1 hypothetical protein H113_08963 [Trichophyton rubrum MR1459]EZG11406.1 hypothetical protein H107_09053 [Trichophyton rubrum CBS 
MFRRKNQGGVPREFVRWFCRHRSGRRAGGWALACTIRTQPGYLGLGSNPGWESRLSSTFSLADGNVLHTNTADKLVGVEKRNEPEEGFIVAFFSLINTDKYATKKKLFFFFFLLFLFFFFSAKGISQAC